MWDLPSQKTVFKVQAHRRFVRGLVCDPSGKTFYSCSDDKTIKRYRLAKKPDKGEEHLLLIRNICVAVAAVLFLLAMVPHLFEHHVKYILRGVAYVFGAGAYASEMLMLTDNFKHMHPFREMFMPYAFGVLYVLMAISYFLEA